MARKSKKDALKDYKATEWSRDFADKIIRGRPTVYDKEKHIPLLLEQFKIGLDVASFCAESQISKRTFHNWLDKHKEFKEAYEHAIPQAESYYKKQAVLNLENDKFNSTLWSMIQRNRFDYTEHRKIKIGFKKGQTFVQQFDEIKEAIKNKEISADEAGKLANLLATGVKIAESTELKAKLEMLEKQFNEQL